MLIDNATQQASAMLRRQKAKSGLAILGYSRKEVIGDPKISNYRKRHSHHGEDLAHAALIAELAVLIGSNTPNKDFYKYTGRG